MSSRDSMSAVSDRWSSSSSSSRSLSTRKKEVGGSWRLSPAMTACGARAKLPTASAGGICEASSKITTSNNWGSTGIISETRIGDIVQQGLRGGQDVRGAAPGAVERLDGAFSWRLLVGSTRSHRHVRSSLR